MIGDVDDVDNGYDDVEYIDDGDEVDSCNDDGYDEVDYIDGDSVGDGDYIDEVDDCNDDVNGLDDDDDGDIVDDDIIDTSLIVMITKITLRN